MRSKIAAGLRAGRSPTQIRQEFVDSYGSWILLSPPRRGLGLVAWALPVLLFAGGLAAGGTAVRRWTRDRRRPRAAAGAAGVAALAGRSPASRAGPRRLPGEGRRGRVTWVLLAASAVMAAVAAAGILRPFGRAGVPAMEPLADPLEDERDGLIRSLRDLEEERRTGAIGDEDYRTLRRETEVRTVAVLRALDAREGGSGETVSAGLAGLREVSPNRAPAARAGSPVPRGPGSADRRRRGRRGGPAAGGCDRQPRERPAHHGRPGDRGLGRAGDRVLRGAGAAAPERRGGQARPGPAIRDRRDGGPRRGAVRGGPAARSSERGGPHGAGPAPVAAGPPGGRAARGERGAGRGRLLPGGAVREGGRAGQRAPPDRPGSRRPARLPRGRAAGVPSSRSGVVGRLSPRPRGPVHS